jgi:uncharacterized protein
MDSFSPQSSNGASGYPGAPWAFRRALARDENLVFPTWGMGDATIALVGAAATGVIVGFVLMQLHIDPANGWGLIISFVTPWIFLIGWPVFATLTKGNGPKLDLGLAAASQHRRLGVIAGLGSLGGALAVAFVITKLFGPLSSTAGDVGKSQHGVVLIVFVLLAMFGAPIAEEIAFRGMLYGALSKAYIPQWAVVVITAAVFALFHFEPKRFLVLFVIGLVLGEVRRRTGSTVAAIIAHSINNTPPAIGILIAGLGLLGK